MAEPEQDEGVPVARGALALFGQGGEVGLVLDGDPRAGQPVLEGGGQAAVPGGQPGRVAEVPGGRVDQARRADADGVQPPPRPNVLARGRPHGAGLLRGALHRRHRLLHGGARSGVGVDRHGRLGEHPPDQVGDEDEDALGADVERGEMGAVGDDAVEPGVGAPALFAGLADHGDQPGRREPVDQVGDRGPGQSGQLLQLPCRERAFLLQQPQGQPVVDGPGGAR